MCTVSRRPFLGHNFSYRYYCRPSVPREGKVQGDLRRLGLDIRRTYRILVEASIYYITNQKPKSNIKPPPTVAGSHLSPSTTKKKATTINNFQNISQQTNPENIDTKLNEQFIQIRIVSFSCSTHFSSCPS